MRKKKVTFYTEEYPSSLDIQAVFHILLASKGTRIRKKLVQSYLLTQLVESRYSNGSHRHPNLNPRSN